LLCSLWFRLNADGGAFCHTTYNECRATQI
jgi:hypothetical protein